jgi:photosystem II stability/assembly factor-like uncharacterized protein
VSDNNTCLVSTRKGLFIVEGMGNKAHVTRAMFLGDHVAIALVDPRDGCWYAALHHGHFGVKLHRSEDQGQSWCEIATPAYPSKPEGLWDRDIWGQERSWSTQGIWALEIAPNSDDVTGGLWCGTAPGGLFRSRDRGASWMLVEALWRHPKRVLWQGGGGDHAALHSICVDPRDPRVVTVAVSTGGVWRTSDDGASWEPRTAGMRASYVPRGWAELPEAQDPHRIVQCRAEPDVWWCQHHEGVWHSTDDGQSWGRVEITPSSFGFAAAVHPRDGKVAWFVPSDSDQRRAPTTGEVVVTRTRDGGQSFDILREGLPQRLAYDLVLRHALAVHEDGERLAFGSSTGHLWVTADQGDHWHAVEGHLPPIYAVTYA